MNRDVCSNLLAALKVQTFPSVDEGATCFAIHSTSNACQELLKATVSNVVVIIGDPSTSSENCASNVMCGVECFKILSTLSG